MVVEHNSSKKNLWKGLSLSVLGVALIVGFSGYYRYSQLHPSSDDAYVNANIVQITPQVSGEVSSIEVTNYQQVKAGQVLFKIDSASYQYAKDQALARLLLDQAKLAVLLAQVPVAEANLKKAEADLFTAKENNHRISALVKNHQASLQEGDQAQGAYLSAEAQVLAMKANVLEAQKNIAVGQHQVEISEANLKTAELNLSYTEVKAPADGRISQFVLRPGSVVQAGDHLFELVEDGVWWMDVNYKETQLESLRPGQFSRVEMDMYPHHVFQGKVLQISPNSGSSFSLLPPENATGNWVKVVQRYPVKVELLLTPEEKAQYPLRVGASSTVTVDLKIFRQS